MSLKIKLKLADDREISLRVRHIPKVFDPPLPPPADQRLRLEIIRNVLALTAAYIPNPDDDDDPWPWPWFELGGISQEIIRDVLVLATAHHVVERTNPRFAAEFRKFASHQIRTLETELGDSIVLEFDAARSIKTASE